MPTELSIEESADEAAQIRSKEQATADALSAQLATTISTNITTTSITIDQQSYTERHSTEIINDEMTSSTTSSNDGASANGFHGSSSSLNGFGKRSSITTPDPIAYVTKARVTRPTPPAPSYNPLQFVAIKPCNLYQTAQEQLKKADEVKKLKEVKKEDPEEWQNNLDSWKSSRRKRVEHIIDRVVEAKKLELEEHDRLRRKSKTFSEMIEDRAERAGSRTLTKLVSLAVYNEEEANDLSDLGIGTSSTSGKSSLSEDYDNNSVMSDNANESTEKCSNGGDKLTSASNGAQQMQLQEQQQQILSTNREYVSSPGYDTSSSTAPASSPEPCEYTYEGAIQDYKQRVSRAVSAGGLTSSTTNGTANKATHNSKDSTPERSLPAPAWPRRGSKIEDRVAGFGLASTTTTNADSHADSQPKVDLPKIDISKRKEIFESQRNSLASSEAPTSNGHVHGNSNAAPVPRVTLRKGFVVESNGSSSSATPPAKVEVRRMSGDITSIRDRLQSLEQQRNSANGAKVIDVPVPPLKQRLSSLQNAVTKDEIRKPPVMLVDERQLEIMKNEDEVAKQRQLKAAFEQQQHQPQQPQIEKPKPKLPEVCEVIVEAVSPTNDLPDEQEQQLNAAIAALALQQQQLEAAANVVNQIEAEFAELADLNPAPLASNKPTVAPAAKPASSAEQPVHDDMEFSINEALELALEAIDKEEAEGAATNGAEDDEGGMTWQPENIPNNQTDEQKNEEQQQQQQHQQQQPIAILKDQKQPTDEEFVISKEPIYENVLLESTSHVDVNLEQQQTTIINNNNNNNNNNNININKNIKNIMNNENSLQTLQQTTTTTMPKTQQEQHGEEVEEEVAVGAGAGLDDCYYQVPRTGGGEPYYDAPKNRRPMPVYENIELYYNADDELLEFGGSTTTTAPAGGLISTPLLPPKEKPPPPPVESPTVDELELESAADNTDNWSTSDNQNNYELISAADRHPSPLPIKRMNSTKRIKKELRNKRSSFLGIESGMDDEETYLELNVAPPPDIAQLLQEERRLEKQLYIKAGLCDSSDTAESRDSGVSENHSRQSSEHYSANSSEENETVQHGTPASSPTPRPIPMPMPMPVPTTNAHGHNLAGLADEQIYQNDGLLATVQQTPLLQTVKGNSAESWTESATAAAAASQSLSEATATANAKMLSIEEKIREQEQVLRVERELLHYSQEELKRQRENLLLRENLARRELQQGAKIMMAANRRSLQDLHNSSGMTSAYGPTKLALQQIPPLQHRLLQSSVCGSSLYSPPQQQIYANVPQSQPQPQRYYGPGMQPEYRKSMSDLNELSHRLSLPQPPPPVPPTKPLRAMQVAAVNGYDRQATVGPYGGSLVKIASSQQLQPQPTAAPRAHLYSNYQQLQQQQNHHSMLNLSQAPASSTAAIGVNGGMKSVPAQQGNMTRNTLLALSATPKPKYTDGWVQVQNRKNYDTPKLANDPAWLYAQQQKRKSMPEAAHYSAAAGHWFVQEAEQRRLLEQQRLSTATTTAPPTINNVNPLSKFPTTSSNGKPLPDSIIQTITERVQSRGIGERQRFDNNYNNNNRMSSQRQTYAPSALPMNPSQQPLVPPTTASGSAPAPAPAPASTQPQTQAQLPTSPPNKFSHVNGKKKCAHCGDELGQGSAMIIESLLLFYHIGCFKCCVCHVQLGDGLNGADVRVRNNQLHCQNCFSSDDGSKFSCV